MGLFHSHRWVEVGRTFTPPHKGKFTMHEAYDFGPLERATHGFTKVEQRCEECGKIRFETVLGDATGG